MATTAEISRVMRELGRRRWKNTGDDPRQVGALGGRPRSAAPRCPCGAMTLKRAQARGHRC